MGSEYGEAEVKARSIYGNLEAVPEDVSISGYFEAAGLA